jgi:hypothetical protein
MLMFSARTRRGGVAPRPGYPDATPAWRRVYQAPAARMALPAAISRSQGTSPTTGKAIATASPLWPSTLPLARKADQGLDTGWGLLVE